MNFDEESRSEKMVVVGGGGGGGGVGAGRRGLGRTEGVGSAAGRPTGKK